MIAQEGNLVMYGGRLSVIQHARELLLLFQIHFVLQHGNKKSEALRLAFGFEGFRFLFPPSCDSDKSHKSGAEEPHGGRDGDG